MDEPTTREDQLWCDHCNRLVKADAAAHDENGVAYCPTCGEEFSTTDTHADDDDAPDDEDAPPKPPWHFKVLLVATVIYLIYRFIWFIFWISHHA
jgi:hypothetical protein